MDTGEKQQYYMIVRVVLRSVAYRSRPVTHNEEEYFGKMAELSEERLCKLVWNYRHIYDVTSPTPTEQLGGKRSDGK